MNATTAIAPIAAAALSGAVAPYAEIALGPDLAKVELPGAAVIDRAALTSALDVAKRFIEKRNTIPILSNVLLQSVGRNLEIIATDLDLAVRITVPGAIDDAFRSTVPGHMLESFLKKAAACEIVALKTAPGPAVKRKVGDGTPAEEMVSEAGVLHIEFERAKYRLNSLPVADFPIMTARPFSHAFAMPGNVLRDMIDGTMGAISSEETRYYLNGIFAHVTGEKLTFIATDGHRLYRSATDAMNGTLGMPGVILPRKFVAMVHKLFSGKACPAEALIYVSDTQARVTWGNIEITTKLIDGTFPDYQRVIPTGNTFAMTVDRDELAEAVKSVCLISSERGRACKFVVSNGRCMLVVHNPETGSAEAEIAADWTGGEFEVGLNYAYLVDAIGEAGAGAITMRFGEHYQPTREGEEKPTPRADAGSPIRLSGSREGWDATLMPMRV